MCHNYVYKHFLGNGDDTELPPRYFTARYYCPVCRDGGGSGSQNTIIPINQCVIPVM